MQRKERKKKEKNCNKLGGLVAQGRKNYPKKSFKEPYTNK